ncbi:MAG TPA: hypothetical protein VK427_08815 [Kofleriaceae bacterium]|nr:hypothetical protein [Kofleriaceae bacterium]
MIVAVLLGTGVASADRKRLVVLDFEGDEAEKIQASFVKFLKKSHTVVNTDKWASAADELGATKLNEKNVKKVAKKLKVDGVITANVEKRRDDYIIRIKLRSGATGELVGSQINAKTDATKLSKTAKSDIEDELFGQIDGLASVRGGGASDEATEEEEEEVEKPTTKADKPKKFGGKLRDAEAEEEEEEAKPSKKDEEKRKKDEERARRDEDRAALASKKDKDTNDSDEAEEEESPLPKSKKGKRGKRTAGGDDDEERIEEDADDTSGPSLRARLSPGNRAVDAVVGVSMNMRRMTFTYDPTIGTRPAGYKGKLVPGGFFDMSVYPLALGHKRSSKDVLKNIGATAMYDQVLLVKSKDASGRELKSAQVRYAFGLLFRYPFGDSPTSPVIGARLRYGSQAFKITQPSPLPSVVYSMFEPGLFFRLPIIGGKVVIDANASFLAVTNTGQIQNQDKYGGATVSGYEVNLGADYHLGEALFLRGMINYETIRYSFKNNGMLPTPADNMKVSAAADNYYGAVVSAGYLF